MEYYLPFIERFIVAPTSNGTTMTPPENVTFNPYYVYLKMVNHLRMNDAYIACLHVFAALSFLFNSAVLLGMLYYVKLKIRSRHVIFINLCITEILAALWESVKDLTLRNIDMERSETYALLLPAIILQSASSLTVIMMVALGFDTYVAIKYPLRYVAWCGKSCKIGIIIVALSWLVMCLIWTFLNCLQYFFAHKDGIVAITYINLSIEVAHITVMFTIVIAATVLQCRIYFQIRETVEPHPNLRRSSATLNSSTTTQLMRKSFYFTIGVTLAAIVLWMPYSIYRLTLSIKILVTYYVDYESHALALQVLHVIYSLNTVLVPALYAFRIHSPVKILRHIILNCCHRNSEADQPCQSPQPSENVNTPNFVMPASTTQIETLPSEANSSTKSNTDNILQQLAKNEQENEEIFDI